ncbi:ammonium transporter [Algibacillus agarilyticus]|uniref:ammonium transporter n=1 Tax=Algibacillus agarilyticus TaxID=2234133 RepID=UPI000DD0CDF3|nr:ammonium transporter [Algibacillus agarilyticus]
MENNIFHLQYAMDTFYFLVCGALVMWMAAGFAMLEAGLVRAKNTTEILTKNVALFAISCIMYLVVGYDIMYGGGVFLQGIETVDSAAVLSDFAAREDGFVGGSIYSGASDFFFQVVFVATAMSIVSGAVAERMKLWAFLAFAVVMTGVIYPLEGGWTWGGNDVFGLYNLGDDFGFSDFAGSGIVHMAGAAAALAGVLLLGARKGKYAADGTAKAIPGANLPLATLGTFILWMGWFGFNGGSVLKLGDIASANSVAMVFLNTNAAAAGGVIGALIVARILFKKADLTMALNGALAGLVAITAEPSAPTALQATLFGALGGVLVVFSILALDKIKIDDPVGAISVHGVVGLLGLLLVPATTDATIVGQLVGAVTIFVWVFASSFVVWFALKAIMGIRVSEEEEYEGVDIAECGMEAYPEFTSGK